MLFGAEHLATLVICTAVATLAYFASRAVAHRARPVAAAIVAALLMLEAFKAWLWIGQYGEPWLEHLPLHLCRISSFLCAAMLWLKSYRLFEVTYFWTLGGSLPAMLTPDLRVPLDVVDFLGFFVGHTLVIVAVLFAIGAYGFRPRLRSIGVTAVVTFAYMGVIALVNLALDTNYLYLCAKPVGASVYDYLGPWPWYLVGITLIGVVICFLCYLPFARVLRRSPQPSG